MLKNFLAKNWQFILIVVLGIDIYCHLFQIPCRWVPDMGYGNGFPLFNFYGPTPYYLGAMASYLIGYIASAKALFFLGIFLGGVAMYIFAKEFIGKLGAFVAGVLFLFAPYRALDGYVRGAVSELIAISLVPLLLYFFYKLMIRPQKKYFVASAITLAVFLSTHNIMTILFTPVLFLWIGLLIYLEEKKGLKASCLAGILGLGLSAFFVVPAYFEKSLVQTEALTRFELNFRAHFVTVKQLFLDRFWGYGASIPGPDDTISLQIGWPLWWLAVLSPIAVFIRKAGKKTRILTAFFFILFCASIFMTHNKSAFVWEKVDILKYFQFPWRFLSLTIFSASFLGGAIVYILKDRLKVVVGLTIVLATILINWGYFKPAEFFTTLTDKDLLSGQYWELQQKGAILDYLPKTALEPRQKATDIPEVKKGTAAVYHFENYSNWWKFITVAETQSYIEVPVFYFPGWEVKVDGGGSTINYENYLGRIGVIVGAGTHSVEGRFADTPTRRLSNILTALSVISLLFVVSYGKTRKIFE
jgi:hypothetical protein